MNQYILADNICRLCKERQLSVEALAEAIEKSPRQVNRYRNGQCENMTLRTLLSIASALQVPLWELMVDPMEVVSSVKGTHSNG